MEVKLVLAKITSFLSRRKRLACRLVSTTFCITIDSDFAAWRLSLVFLRDNTLPKFSHSFAIPFLNKILFRVEEAAISDFKKAAPRISDFAIAANTLTLCCCSPFGFDDGDMIQLRNGIIGYYFISFLQESQINHDQI
jgi:hypothetical protein